ncbi:hypothetical protein BDW02DRAFT_385625 [Decorospora gaudefroyi]|uniref:Uncharacterized protein n=1 Tax=Decorospora gaudefroyi TaxID=184978 RepID=A0A6A5KAJ5_9PLEO|nr:hypothetical protein BDW02DRAFT_385625 [Decorospora gaudefroyi]
MSWSESLENVRNRLSGIWTWIVNLVRTESDATAPPLSNPPNMVPPDVAYSLLYPSWLRQRGRRLVYPPPPYTEEQADSVSDQPPRLPSLPQFPPLTLPSAIVQLMGLTVPSTINLRLGEEDDTRTSEDEDVPLYTEQDPDPLPPYKGPRRGPDREDREPEGGVC